MNLNLDRFCRMKEPFSLGLGELSVRLQERSWLQATQLI